MKVTLIDSPEELPDFEERWESLRRECGGTVFASNYLTRAWFEGYGHIAEPRVIVVEDGGDLVGVAPLTTYQYRIGKLPVKVLALAGEMRDRLRLSTTSLLFMPERKDILDLMMREIKRLDWNLFTMINLVSTPANTTLIEEVRTSWQSYDFPPGRMLTAHFTEGGRLFDTLDTKTKKNIRYRLNLLEREGHHIEFRRLPADGIDQAVDLYAKHHIERWASKGGSYFQNPDNVRYLKLSTASSYRAGIGHVFELLIDGRIAAQDFDILDGETCYGDKTGMSNDFLRYSPGWLVMMHAMDQLQDRGAKRCVMGIGGESYKYEMGGVESPLIGIRATRGLVAVLSKVSASPLVQKVSTRLGFKGDEVAVNVPRT
ncbi:MAG: GNAT family N-acetyltransferase [Methanomassiliicoccus sp.]|nr:GNAT family N-acetyltransferase [Methanomassiliicoccus sp.]